MKFIIVTQVVVGQQPAEVHLNQDHITYLKATSLSGMAATRVDLIGGNHIFVSEVPQEILRLTQTRQERAE